MHFLLDKHTKVCVYILLSMLLFPILLKSFWIGLILAFTYTILHILIRKEKDEYCKEVLIWGVFLMYFGLECSILVFIQYDLSVSLFVTTSLFMVAYEIYVGLNLSFKKYSLHKAKSFSFGNIIPLLFGGTGIWFGKVLADMDHTDFKLWIVIVGCSMLITGAFSFIQKAVIFKILNKERV